VRLAILNSAVGRTPVAPGPRPLPTARGGSAAGWHDGYADKRVQAAGPIQLKMPQVRNTIAAFESVWLRTLARRSDKLTVLIPQLYVKGLSTGDIEVALSAFHPADTEPRR
jgi:hypothetical protein